MKILGGREIDKRRLFRTDQFKDDRKGPLFRSAIGKTRKPGTGAMSRTDVWYLVRRSAGNFGFPTSPGCHTGRATGITDYLTNGGVSKSRSAWTDTALITGRLLPGELTAIYVLKRTGRVGIERDDYFWQMLFDDG